MCEITTIGICEICGREQILNFHHLIPKQLHTKQWFINRFTKDELGNGIWICKHACHKEIHKFFSNPELGRCYYTLELLLGHYKIQNYIKWIIKQKNNRK